MWGRESFSWAWCVSRWPEMCDPELPGWSPSPRRDLKADLVLQKVHHSVQKARLREDWSEGTWQGLALATNQLPQASHLPLPGLSFPTWNQGVCPCVFRVGLWVG